MSGIRTDVNTHFVEASYHSNFIQTTLSEHLLGNVFWMDRTGEFTNGDELRTPSVGQRTVQSLSKNDTQIEPRPIATGETTLTINNFIGDAFYIEDTMRQDGFNIQSILTENALQQSMAIGKEFETNAWSTLNAAQTPGAANAVNGFAHRLAGQGIGGFINQGEFIRMGLAFDKANVPLAGRICIVDPVVAATLTGLLHASAHVDSNMRTQGIFENGLTANHKFVMNYFGWDVFVSNLLPTIASETVDNQTITGGVANLFMNVSSDNTKPLTGAWRQHVETESRREESQKRDYFFTSARYGLAHKRVETLGVVVTSATVTGL